jgi:hypothetical protein
MSRDVEANCSKFEPMSVYNVKLDTYSQGERSDYPQQ